MRYTKEQVWAMERSEFEKTFHGKRVEVVVASPQDPEKQEVLSGLVTGIEISGEAGVLGTVRTAAPVGLILDKEKSISITQIVSVMVL